MWQRRGWQWKVKCQRKIQCRKLPW
jgi:hypothetical protein